jgi:hypothetical protein
MRRRSKIAGILCFLVFVTKLAAQQSSPSVSVSGSVTQPLTLTSADLARMPRAIVTINNGGIATRYEGVWLHEILRKAGVPLGEQLRGKALTTYVLAEAQDGYQVVFSIGELDPALADNHVLLADRQMASAFRK